VRISSPLNDGHIINSVRNGYLTYRRSVRDLSNGCGHMSVKAMFILYWLAFRAATKNYPV